MLIKNTFIDFGVDVYVFEKVDKLPRTKENAFLHYIVMTCRSWTFNRMTETEKENCINTFLYSNRMGFIKGSFEMRWKTMHAIYSAFLSALGYDNNPADWRGKDDIKEDLSA